MIPSPALAVRSLDVPVDPDAEQARQWAVDELSKQPYQAAKPGLLQQIWQSIVDFFNNLVSGLQNFTGADGRALAQAADNLRAAALQRLAIRFRIGREASADAVVLAVLEHSALPEAEVRRILQPAKPASESQFLIWAQQLETLEREVEREP